MHIDMSEPWVPLSTPEVQRDADLREAFEDARDAVYAADEALDRARDAWQAWRDEFRASLRDDDEGDEN